MFCSNCGSALPDNTQVCPECGYIFTAAPASGAESAPASAETAAPASQSVAPDAAAAYPTGASPAETLQMPAGYGMPPQPASSQPTGAQAPYMQQPAQPQGFGAQSMGDSFAQQQGFGAQPMMGGAPQPGAVPASPYVTPPAAAPAKKKSMAPKVAGIVAALVALAIIIGAMAGGGSEGDGGDDSEGLEPIHASSGGDGTTESSGDDEWFDDVDVTGDEGSEGADAAPADPDADLTPQPEPANGEVLLGGDRETYSTITITAADDAACYAKLKDADGNDVYGFYVAAGQTAEVGVPAGQCYIYFASGETWYGLEDLFGANTSYSKDPEILDLDSYTYTYTLHGVAGGNFQTEDVDEGEF